jgi:hypothetical protein
MEHFVTHIRTAIHIRAITLPRSSLASAVKTNKEKQFHVLLIILSPLHLQTPVKDYDTKNKSCFLGGCLDPNFSSRLQKAVERTHHPLSITQHTGMIGTGCQGWSPFPMIVSKSSRMARGLP